MKLNTEQATQLRGIYNSHGAGNDADFQAVGDAYLRMLTESRAYAVIKAPEGMRVFRVDFERPSVRIVHREPIPKPCPAPKLDAVSVTVKSVYPFSPPQAIPEGYMAEFGEVSLMLSKGFTHYISPITLLIVEIHAAAGHNGNMRICLKKWESQ